MRTKQEITEKIGEINSMIRHLSEKQEDILRRVMDDEELSVDKLKQWQKEYQELKHTRQCLRRQRLILEWATAN